MRRLLGCPRGLATRAGPLWAGGGASQGPEAVAGVSGAAFSALLRRCGLSGRQLRALYAPGGSSLAGSALSPQLQQQTDGIARA